MKKNRRLLFLIALLFVLSDNFAISQIVCNSNIVAALAPSSSGSGSSLKIFAQSIVENDDEVDNLQISLDNVNFADFLTFYCEDIGSHTVYAKGDINGVQSTCFSTLTVEDKLKPVAYAQNVTVSLNGGNSVTVLPSVVDAGSFDNCSIASMSLSQSTFTSNGSYVVDFTVTDPSGNSTFATVLITVVGGVPVCNESLYLSLDFFGQADVGGDIFLEGAADYDLVEVSLDNVNFGPTVNFDCDDAGSTHTVYVHVEQDGNDYDCSTEVMVEDKTAPVVIVEVDFIINLASETDTYTLTADEIDEGSYDTCSDIVLELSQTEYTIDDWGTNLVTLTATDDSGNSNSAFTHVIVQVDGEAPPLQCVSLSTAVASPWGETELWAIDFVINEEDFDQVLGSLDPAGPFTESFLVDCGINGGDPYTVYVQAFSGQDMYTCDVELTVVDNSPPIVVAKQNLVLVLVNGTATLSAEDLDNGSYDGCTDITISIDQTVFTDADIGINQVWLTATDENGNYNMTWTYVTVTNGTGCNLANVIFPNLIEIYDPNGTSDDISVDDLQSIYGYTYEEVHPYTVSECPAIYYTYSDVLINSGYGFKIVRTWTALDWLTAEVITDNQLIIMYNDYNSTLACNDQISVSVGSEPYTVLPEYVLEGGPYNYDNMTLVIEDSNDNVVVDNIITADYEGQTLNYTVTDIITDNSCWGTIVVDGIIGGCPLDEDEITYPLATIQLPEFNLDPWSLTPDYLIENYGYEMSEVLITWVGNECTIVGYTYEDNLFDFGNGSFKIVREITVVDWIAFEPGSEEGIWTFTQTIYTGIDPASLICDFLPRTADVGDCESGHTLDDDVEWPADLEIEDYRITPAELVEFSMVDVLDSEPSFYNNVDDYEASYVDLLVDLSTTSLTIGRVWTVNHVLYDFVWTYSQTIVVDFTDFENLVTVNTGTNNRAMPGVMINDAFSTNNQGIAYVSDNPVDNVSYEDDYLNGLNVLDYVLLQRQILELESLGENAMLAADVNLDGNIEADDVVLLRNRILGNNKLYDWSFYNKIIDGPITIEPKAAFTAIKSGDLDDSALLQGDAPLEPVDKFDIYDILLNVGESYSIPVFLEQNYSALGVEFRVKIDEDLLKVSDVTTDETYENFSFEESDGGVLTIMFANVDEVFAIGGGQSAPVFNLHFEAQANGLLNEALDMDNQLSYIATSDLNLVVLGGEIEDAIGTGTNDEELSSLAVYPNPTSDYLNIDLKKVDVKGDVQVTIYELNGQKLFSRFNDTRIDVSDLNSGMYYYQVKIDTYTTTGKFIVID